MQKFLHVLFFICAMPIYAADQFVLDGLTTFTLATPEQAAGALGVEDDYVRKMTPWELAARMGREGEATRTEYLEHVERNVLPWADEERRELILILTSLEEGLRPYASLLPRNILIAKTTGNEDNGDAYTRFNVIVIQQETMNLSTPILRLMMAHEVFHVLSRHNPGLKDKLYGLLGYTFCGEVERPAKLERLRITNPDAPLENYCIRVKWEGKEYSAIPIVHAVNESLGADSNGDLNFFGLDPLMLIHPGSDGRGFQPIMRNGEPLLVNKFDVTGFDEQVGKNTVYNIHPEETLADNFAYLVLGRKILASPEIVESLKKTLLAAVDGQK